MFVTVYIFFICSIKFPQCTDKNNKTNFSIAIFLASVLMYQKRQISLPVEYKTARPKTGDWEWLWCHFRTWSFAKNRFPWHFLIFLQHCTFVPFFSEFISSESERRMLFMSKQISLPKISSILQEMKISPKSHFCLKTFNYASLGKFYSTV